MRQKTVSAIILATRFVLREKHEIEFGAAQSDLDGIWRGHWARCGEQVGKGISIPSAYQLLAVCAALHLEDGFDYL